MYRMNDKSHYDRMFKMRLLYTSLDASLVNFMILIKRKREEDRTGQRTATRKRESVGLSVDQLK